MLWIWTWCSSNLLQPLTRNVYSKRLLQAFTRNVYYKRLLQTLKMLKIAPFAGIREDEGRSAGETVPESAGFINFFWVNEMHVHGGPCKLVHRTLYKELGRRQKTRCTGLPTFAAIGSGVIASATIASTTVVIVSAIVASATIAAFRSSRLHHRFTACNPKRTSKHWKAHLLAFNLLSFHFLLVFNLLCLFSTCFPLVFP